jgi:hypothetical protein
MATPSKFHKAFVPLLFLVCFFLPAKSAFKSVEAETAEVPSAATTVFAKVSKSVVVVEALSPAGRAQGSGVVIHNNSGAEGELSLERYWRPFSYAVTNAHVVKNASRVLVLQGGARYLADVKYVDDEFDLALLMVEGVLLPGTPPISGAQLKVGERVFAIGSPLGLENSISEGIISGKREENGVLFLQSTTPISRGSSGGGLFDTIGSFVGVTTFKLAGGENLNFAVDAYRVHKIFTAWMASTFLCLAAEVGAFSPDEKALINSKALVDWLLTRDKNDMKLSLEIIRESASYVHSSEAEAAQLLDKVEKEYTQILASFLSDQGTKGIAKGQNKAELVVIVCT